MIVYKLMKRMNPENKDSIDYVVMGSSRSLNGLFKGFLNEIKSNDYYVAKTKQKLDEDEFEIIEEVSFEDYLKEYKSKLYKYLPETENLLNYIVFHKDLTYKQYFQICRFESCIFNIPILAKCPLGTPETFDILYNKIEKFKKLAIISDLDILVFLEFLENVKVPKSISQKILSTTKSESVLAYAFNYEHLKELYVISLIRLINLHLDEHNLNIVFSMFFLSKNITKKDIDNLLMLIDIKTFEIDISESNTIIKCLLSNYRELDSNILSEILDQIDINNKFVINQIIQSPVVEPWVLEKILKLNNDFWVISSIFQRKIYSKEILDMFLEIALKTSNIHIFEMLLVIEKSLIKEKIYNQSDFSETPKIDFKEEYEKVINKYIDMKIENKELKIYLIRLIEKDKDSFDYCEEIRNTYPKDERGLVL